MFESARIKLTAWYLLILMAISVFFSIAFYEVSTREVRRILRRQQIVQGLWLEGFPGSPRPLPQSVIDDLEDEENHLKLNLFFVNSGIFVIAGGLGFLLAGRTLRPIAQMVDEQNRFIADASHEFRTPITALRSEMEATLLEEKVNAKNARALVQSNLEEVVKLQSLSDKLLELAQFQNKQRFDPKVISLSEVVNEALKKVTPLARRKQITIRNLMKDIQVKGDKPSLSELFTIVLDNAIKYTQEKGQISIKSKKMDHKSEVTISDNGIGIAAKDIPYIFDRFYRADKSRNKTEVSGYGLGLSIAKKIVIAHQGTISLKSKEGKGTDVSVYLPA